MDETSGYFSGGVIVEQVGEWWRIYQPLDFTSRDGTTVHVPVGFITDFASIPRIFWNIAPPTSPFYSRASLVHDRLYETHQVPREQADAYFYEAMLLSGSSHALAWTLWSAVRAFGSWAYNTGPSRQAARIYAFH